MSPEEKDSITTFRPKLEKEKVVFEETIYPDRSPEGTHGYLRAFRSLGLTPFIGKRVKITVEKLEK